MGQTNENVGPKILAKIKIYVLTRAELLFKVCYEIPCSKDNIFLKKCTSENRTTEIRRNQGMSVQCTWRPKTLSGVLLLGLQ